MNELKKTIFYLKKFPALSIAILFFTVFGSVFDGFSLGMLIPILQSMISPGVNPVAGIPLINKLQFLFVNLNQKEALSYLLLFMFFMIVTKNIFLFFGNVLIAKLRFSLTKNLQTDLFNQLLGYGVKFFDSAKIGHLASNIYNESTRIGDFMFAILQLAGTTIKIMIYTAVIFIISWKFSLIALILVAFVFPPAHYIMKKMREIGYRCSAALSGFNFRLLETLNGIRVVKSFGTEEYEKNRFKEVANNIYDANYRNRKYASAVPAFSEVIIVGSIVITFLILTRVIALNLTNLVPLIVAYSYILFRVLGSVTAFNSFRTEAAGYVAAFDSYGKLIEKKDKPIILDGKEEIDRFKESIQFKNVTFSYQDNKEVLKNINLLIPQGKITAIVGVTGAGKSSLVNLVPRLYEPQEGRILIDGIDLRELKVRAWRRKIGIVSQEIFVFNTTIRENIIYGFFEVSDKEIEEAAKTANAHEFIISLPNGYETIVGEKGIKLSGGERQRISIARAIIHNPEILILDEATSSLDTRTEQLIQEAIDRLTKDRTVIAIAHRLSTIRNADNIVVLNKGKIVEQGRHEELLKRGSFYKNFYELQYTKDR